MDKHFYPILQSVLVHREARVVVRVGYPLLLVTRADVEERSRRGLLVGREVLPGHERAHHFDGRFPENLPHGLFDRARHPLVVDHGPVAALVLEVVGGAVTSAIPEMIRSMVSGTSLRT